MSITKIAVFVIIVVALIGGGVWYNRYLDNKSQERALAEREQQAEAQQKLISDLMAKLKITDVTVGTGAEAKNGDLISVNYAGTLVGGKENGKEFDSSYKRNQPFEFTLGASRVIAGFDLGVLGMKVGGKRTIVISPDLGYGDQEMAAIPANSTLKFTVELLSVNASSTDKYTPTP